MYADYEYYISNYAGEKITSCRKVNKYLRVASMEIDRFTFGRFRGKLPNSKTDAMKLQECTCEIADALARIDDEIPNVVGDEGTINGVKVFGAVSSISSGSESISFKSSDSVYANAMRSAEKRDALIYSIVRRYLAGISVNGINVLYSGVM